jgi:peptidoglycan-associated lipoprotein
MGMKRILLLAILVGCHKQAQVKSVASATPAKPAPAATGETKPPAEPAQTANLGVSGDLARECSLSIAHVDRAPKFAFDQFELLPEDREVLDKIAACVTSGPLKGKKLSLTGRADPRGTEEYNLGLGTRRARTVGTYLERLGVQTTQLAETTRGALDAEGRDDAGWTTDRRVDVDIARN